MDPVQDIEDPIEVKNTLVKKIIKKRIPSENTFNLIDNSPIELWENDSISENLLLDFTDENGGNTIPFPTDLNNLPWWLELLERPSEHYYREFNNFSNTYLSNSIWKTTNPV
ncbi:15843_t:CDS:2, partial [Dentiscutata erythropus]